MTDSADYIPPKVWEWNVPSGGQFASINRPVAGPTHDKELSVGKHPLAEKFGDFLPEFGAARAETLSWLFWQMGSAPFLGGGFGHFFAYAPTKQEYPINRYAMETKRQLDVLDRRLADNEFVNGRDYSIADIAIWPWYGQLALDRSYKDAGEFLSVGDYANVQRWARQVDARPAVKRGRIVNKTNGDPTEQPRERHDASDFDLRTQDKLKAA